MTLRFSRPRILSIFGTRPEAIKMAPVVTALTRTQRVEARVCVTGQHREMLDQVLSLFEIRPDYDLNLMKPNQQLTDITCSILQGLNNIFTTWRPNWVVVHGDTTTTFAASLAAYYQKIQVAHVEAGLRTRNIYSPWPEEVNRRLVAPLAAQHFAPTPLSKKHLLEECIPDRDIEVTGNTVIDALLSVVQKLNSDSSLKLQLENTFRFLDKSKHLIVVTGHRRENFGSGIENVCRAIAKLSNRDDVQIVYSLHPNPNIRKPVSGMLGSLSNVFLIEPQDYLPFVYLMNRSYFMITDSGGIQEEAPSLGKPVLVTRDTTERPEALEAGTVKLVGTETSTIVSACYALLDDQQQYDRMRFAHNPYGDGNAATRIVQTLCNRAEREFI